MNDLAILFFIFSSFFCCRTTCLAHLCEEIINDRLNGLLIIRRHDSVMTPAVVMLMTLSLIER
jgi:hypothetical protein